MYQLVTNKGRMSCETIESAAEWLAEMQPLSSRITLGDIETEIDDDVDLDLDAAGIAAGLRWALRMEEAFRLNLTVNNDNIYLVGFSGPRTGMVYLRRDTDGVTLVDARNEVSRTLPDGETVAELLAAVLAENR